ncbi:MAG: adenine phosphoribosyltransferase [Proteobacteria bacterium]|nr:adenine phosphoribosyltransferase [Pseudomonadota bacterium]
MSSFEHEDFTEAKEKIREIPDFPRQGIRYKDITPVLQDGRLFARIVERMVKQFYDKRVDYVISPECRGFVLGSAVAIRLGAGFIPARKKGRLPFKTIKVTYNSDYPDVSKEENVLFIHEDALRKGNRILIIDDMLSSGGTIRACKNLVETLGGEVVGAGVMVDLGDARSKDILQDLSVYSCVRF